MENVHNKWTHKYTHIESTSTHEQVQNINTKTLTLQWLYRDNTTIVAKQNKNILKEKTNPTAISHITTNNNLHI